MSELDLRQHAYRADLADIRLQNQVQATRYVTGTPGTIITPISNLRGQPTYDAPVTTQALLGETLMVFETRDGWHWVQLDADGYVGYLPVGDADTATSAPPTHRITATLAHVYAQASVKSEPLEMLPFGAKIYAVGSLSDEWLTLTRGGYIKSAAVRPLPTMDYVAIAHRFLHAPYLWGGRTAAGMDCSGLVQTALHAAGIPCPRDSDQQEAGLGEPLPANTALQRGDLIFFKGHVGMMLDGTNLLHANATTMTTAIEALTEVEKRAAVTSRRRMH